MAGHSGSDKKKHLIEALKLYGLGDAHYQAAIVITLAKGTLSRCDMAKLEEAFAGESMRGVGNIVNAVVKAAKGMQKPSSS